MTIIDSCCSTIQQPISCLISRISSCFTGCNKENIPTERRLIEGTRLSTSQTPATKSSLIKAEPFNKVLQEIEETETETETVWVILLTKEEIDAKGTDVYERVQKLKDTKHVTIIEEPWGKGMMPKDIDWETLTGTIKEASQQEKTFVFLANAQINEAP
ncbi:MAG: hypothetical protein VW378_06105 [bacterium]